MYKSHLCGNHVKVNNKIYRYTASTMTYLFDTRLITKNQAVRQPDAGSHILMLFLWAMAKT